jgi:mannose-6-phosphate isomerase-like protein (cupin superfamily)
MGEITTRPWGTYEVLYDGPECKVKRLIIKAGHRISLQSHKFRDEHWLFVSGKPLVELFAMDSTIMNLIYTPGVGTYRMIPKGWKHRISAEGKYDTIIIETQLGSSYDEDDITRYEDDFGRVVKRDAGPTGPI